MTATEEFGKIQRHVIVGDGITAAAFADGLNLKAGDELVVIGDHATQLGRGIAYAEGDKNAPWYNAYLLNSPADDIDPKFARWLEENWTRLAPRMEGRKPDWLGAAQALLERGDIYGLNAPRSFYGEFMQEQVANLLDELGEKEVSVSLIDDRALSIDQENDMLMIATERNSTIAANSADVAPGGPSTQRFPGDNGPHSAPTLFGNEERIAEHIHSGAEILCVGANATMLDALRLCQSLVEESKLNFVACSPNGSLPPALIPRLPRVLTQPSLTDGHETAQDLLDEIALTMEDARTRGHEMREIRAGFRAYFVENGLNRFLKNDQEARKIPKVLRHWLRGGTNDTIRDLRRFVDEGKCRIMKGGVQEIRSTGDHAQVLLRDSDGQTHLYDTFFVINCACAGPV